MEIQNTTANTLSVHDPLDGRAEEQYQGGIKEATLTAAGTSGATRQIQNTNAGESISLGAEINAGNILISPVATETANLSSTVTIQYDTGGTPTDAAVNAPAVPGVIGGYGKVIYAGYHWLAVSGAYRIALTPLTANANEPDMAVLGHIDPNNTSTDVPYGVIVGTTAGSGTITVTADWTEASGSTAGDADAIVTIAETGTSDPAGVAIIIVA